MQRIIVAFACLAFLAGCASGPAEKIAAESDSNLIYSANFDDGTPCGFNGSGAYTWGMVSDAQCHSPPYSFLVYDRRASGSTASWNMAGQIPAERWVTFSAWVYLDGDAAAAARIQAGINGGAGTAGGRGVTIAEKQAEPRTWTYLEGDVYIEKNDVSVRASVFIADNADNFYVDDVVVKLKDGNMPYSGIQENLAPLKDAPRFKERNILIGSGVGTIVLNDPSGNRQKLVAKHYDSITAENELKANFLMEYGPSVRDLSKYNEEVALNFNLIKPYYDFALKNGLKMSAQAMLWDQLTPEWFFHVDYDEHKPYASRTLMLKRTENFIKDVLDWSQTNYPGMVKMWVIVNEGILGNNPPALRENRWLKTIGEDYIARAFEYARKYSRDTDMDLVYNDFNMEAYPARLQFLLDYIKKYNVDLDAIGFQMHIKMDFPSASTIKANLEKAGKYKVYISEMDIANGDPSPASMEAQGQRYFEVYSAILDADVHLRGISSWCLTDGNSWLINNQHSAQFPLLWDMNNQAKPAYYGVMRAAGSAVK
ncbi:MAG: endo-1,4-beta-xylanase [Treponema sp.]|nr:endo-1,4-beta-xylanase [Treponema sp.]